MKNRLFAFLLVFVFVLSFPVVASADSSISIVGELIENFLESAFDSGDYGFLVGVPSAGAERFQDLSDEDRQNIMSAYRNKMREADEFEPVTNSTGWASNLKPIEYYLQMAVGACRNPRAPAFTTGNYHYIIYAVSDPNGYYRINVKLIYDTNHYTDWNYHLDRYNCPSVDRGDYSKKFDFVTSQIVDDTAFGGTICGVSSASYYTNEYICNTNVNPSASDIYCYVTDFLGAPLRFASNFSEAPHQLYKITLTANKPVPDDLFAVFGVLYNDGTHVYDGTDCGYINADYIGSASLQGGHEWEWHFNQKDFSNWAYRKRIFDTDCFYAFVHVLDGDKIVYADSRKLNLNAPTDIFADTQKLPDYLDYVNTPISLPNLLPSTFNYSPTNTYQTINNYSGTDFDFASFFGWYEDAFTVMSNNMAAFFANAQAFMGAFADFNINGILNACANIGSLIDDLNLNLTNNVNNLGDYLENLGKSIDFNNKILIDNINSDIQNSLGGLSTSIDNFDTSFTNYFSDLISTISNNLDTIIDNLETQAEAELVPDKVYVDWLVDNALPWYSQIRDALNSASYNNSSLQLTVDFGDVLGIHTITYDDTETATQIRSVFELILIASTVAGCARLGFQILGIDVSMAKGGE